jgi:phosphate-selective porin OprO and OprP
VFAQTTPPTTQPNQTPSEPASPAATTPAAPSLSPVSPSVDAPADPSVPAAAERTAPPAVIAPPEQPVTPPIAAPVVEEKKKEDPNAGAVTFKPGKGVDIKSADGNFSVNTRLKTQLLYQLEKPVHTADTDAKSNFAVRRMRLAFQGNVFSKNIKYKLEMTFAASELNRRQPTIAGSSPAQRVDRDVVEQVPLLDAYFDFTHLRDLNVRVGQSKVPFGRERVLSDNEMIVIDRSLEDVEFNFDRDMGIDIRSTDFLGVNLLHYVLGVFMAEERNATFSSLGVGDPGLLYLARLELVPFGNFEETPGDFERGSPKLSIGVAYSYLQTDANSPYARQSLGRNLGNLNDPGKVDYNVSNFTADFLFKGGGLSLMGAFHYRKASSLPALANDTARDGLGLVVQGGYLLSKEVPLELAASYGMTRRLEKDKGNLPQSNELTFGLNYYPFNVHFLKLQAEYGNVWYQADTRFAPPNHRVRVQLQIML